MAEAFPHRLKARMDALGLSARALAQKVEPENARRRENLRTDISKWRNGRQMTEATAQRIAPHLDWDVDELLIRDLPSGPDLLARLEEAEHEVSEIRRLLEASGLV